MNAEQCRAEIAAAPIYRLRDLSKAFWAAYADGQITEAEAEALDTLIQERTPPATAPGHSQASETETETPAATTITKPPARRTGSRPRSPDSMFRRRTWAAGGRLPPTVACHYTIAEQATLAVVAAEIVKRGDCRLSNGEIAARAGVSVSLARAAIRRARMLGHLSAEIRRVERYRNMTTILRVVSTTWTAWMRRGPMTSRAERALTPGAKPQARTNTSGKKEDPSGSWYRPKNGFRGDASRPTPRSRWGT